MFHISGTAYRIIFDQKEKALSIFHGYRLRAITMRPIAFQSFIIKFHYSTFNADFFGFNYQLEVFLIKI